MFTYIIHKYETDEKVNLIERKTITSLKGVSNYLDVPASSIAAYIDGKKCNRRLKRYKITKCNPSMSGHRLELITTKMKAIDDHEERIEYIRTVLQEYAEALDECN